MNSNYSKYFNLKNPLPAIGNFFITKPHIWLSFSIPFTIMAFAYFYFGVYPAGNRSVLSLDLNAQYVYYFAYMKDALFGPESILYSWGRNLSGEFVGIIGYYLFSPFNLLVWIFPHSHITEGLLLMMLFKIGFIGVTMSIYLSIGRGFSKHTTVLFSIMYALISYNIVQTMNPMWLDGVMALPLVVMGIEALVKQGKYKLLAFSLVYSFITCFYIGYMIGIFAALYFVYYALTSRKFSKGNVAVIAKRTGLFATVSVLSVMMSAFILLPVYSALSLGKFEFSDPDYSIRNSFNLLEITRKLFLNSYDTVRMDGQPFLFSGTLALLTVPAYFFCDRIRRARRYGGVILLLAMTLSMYITPIDMFWHGMQVPNWLPYRYSFVICFLFLKFGAEAFENIKKIPYKVIGGSAAAFCVLLIYWEQTDTFMADLGGGRDVFDWFKVILPAMGALIFFAGFLMLARNRLNKTGIFAGVLIVFVSLEMLFNTHMSILKQNEDIIYSTRDSYNDSMIPTREVTNRINREDKSFFRMEKTYIRSANDPMALRMKGVTHSSSMLNERAIAILKSLGYSSRSHASRYSGNTPLTDDLFGFKYRLSCVDDNHGNIYSANDITVTENHDVLPIAYLVYPKLLDFAFEGEKGKDGGRNSDDDVFYNQNQMLSYMLGEDGNEYFKQMEWTDRRPQNLIFEQLGDGYSGYSRGGEPVDAHIEYDFIAEEDGDVFMYFPTVYERKSNLWLRRYADGEPLDAKFIGQVYETDHHHIQPLGHFKKGENFMMTLSLPEETEKIFFREEWVMRLDADLLEADIARLHAINEHTEFRAVTNRHLRINTNYTHDMLLFTSIPAEPGWKATVNGKRVDIKEVAGGLMAVHVPAGNGVVDLKFFPYRMPLGIALSLAGLFGMFVLGVVLTKWKTSVSEKSESASEKVVTDINNTDDYDGFDSDYVNLDTGDEDFNFDEM